MDRKFVKHFQTVDSILFSLTQIVSIEEISPRKPSQYFASLCNEIIGQQLSGRVADVIFERFKKLFPRGHIIPPEVCKVSGDQLRKTGMSWSKVHFIKDLANKVAQKEVSLSQLQHLTNNEVIRELTKIKGIGPWTAEMFLMFTLGREDIFSFGDLGLKKAIMKAYALRREPSKKKLATISRRWSPYRTYAARILWRSLEVR